VTAVAPPRAPASELDEDELAPLPPRIYRRANSRNRVIYLTFAVLVILSVYAGRVFDLMVVKGASLAAKGEAQRQRTTPLLADRGPIYDSTGAVMAVTTESRNITADQNLIKDPAGAAATLARLLEMDPTALQTRLTGTDRFVYVVKGVTPEKWRQVQAQKIQGIFSEKVSKRTYPGGTLGANVLGYVDTEGRGKAGIELMLDSQLHGVDGKRTYEQGAQGQAIPTADEVISEPIAGMGVQLTLNRDISYVAQRAIASQVKAAKADSGTAIVMEAKTGRILAMATAPTFDPNNYGKAKAENLGNRPVSEIYEPGSTGKLLTLSAVVEEGKAKPRSRMTVPPVLTRGGHTTHDHTEHGTLHLTLNGVFAHSSNIGTILFADKIGGNTLYEYQRKFGIGQPTGLGFPGEEQGILPKPENWWPTTFQALAYGQSYSVTSLQVASVYQTIANGGVRLTPRIIDGYVKPDGTFEAAPTQAGTRVVSEQTARTMAQMLENVVTEGTGVMTQIPGYRVAGKTGTAERAVQGGYSGFSASFIGFAPADDPAVVVQVVLQNPRNGHYGGTLGGPVFKTVMTYSLQELKVPPSGTKSPTIPTEW
jgi:cell division protein FtsI (penicillin-binding protein 3)